MSKSGLQTEIIYNYPEKGTVFYSGYLKITSPETITIESISGQILFEIRGRIEGFQNVNQYFEVGQKMVLMRNNTYEIPFSFDPKKLDKESYRGKNVSFNFRCELSIELNKHSYSKLDFGIISSIKSMISDTTTITTSKNLVVAHKNEKYKVKESNSGFELKSNFSVTALLLVLFGTVYISLIPDVKFFYHIIFFSIIFSVISRISKRISNVFGTITRQIKEHDSGQFICQIIAPKTFNCTKIYFEIIEEAVDKRGTSSESYRVPVYKSKEQDITKLKSNSEIYFDYPNKSGLSSRTIKDAALLWYLVVEGKTYMGMTLKYKSEFKGSKSF